MTEDRSAPDRFRAQRRAEKERPFCKRTMLRTPHPCLTQEALLPKNVMPPILHLDKPLARTSSERPSSTQVLDEPSTSSATQTTSSLACFARRVPASSGSGIRDIITSHTRSPNSARDPTIFAIGSCHRAARRRWFDLTVPPTCPLGAGRTVLIDRKAPPHGFGYPRVRRFRIRPWAHPPGTRWPRLG